MKTRKIPTRSFPSWDEEASEQFSCARKSLVGWNSPWRLSVTRRRKRSRWWRWKLIFYRVSTTLRSFKFTMRSIMETNFIASWNCKTINKCNEQAHDENNFQDSRWRALWEGDWWRLRADRTCLRVLHETDLRSHGVFTQQQNHSFRHEGEDISSEFDLMF